MIDELKKGAEREFEIEAATFGGQGVARIEDFVVFVSNAIPGDRVLARILKKKKSFAEAQTLKIIKPSSQRIRAVCEHFGVCGGCRWQDVAYEAQLEFKRKNVEDIFQRIGNYKDIIVPKPLGSPKIFNYRNKMEFTFGDRPWLLSMDQDIPYEAFALGMHVPQRFDKVLNINTCHLTTPLVNDILNFMKTFAKQSGLAPYNLKTHEGFWRFLVIRQTEYLSQTMVNVITSSANEPLMQKLKGELISQFPQVTSLINGVTERRSQVAIHEKQILLSGAETMIEKLGEFQFEISSSSFFQTNTLGAEILYRTALEMADLTGRETMFDLYSGTGSIAIYMSKKAKHIWGVELVESATRDAKRNASLNGVTNCEFVNGDMKDIIKNAPDKPDVVILDPPRSGTHEDVLKALLDLEPNRIVYVSCNPSTQARDLNLLDSKYQLSKIQPVDMFPHTYHIENVVRMDKR